MECICFKMSNMKKFNYFLFLVCILSLEFVKAQGPKHSGIVNETDYLRKGQRTIVSGKIHNYKQGDSVKLIVWNEIFSERYTKYLSSIELTSISNSGEFKFTVNDMQKFAYFSLYSGTLAINGYPNELFENSVNEHGIYLIGSGDSLVIEILKDTITFSGQGKDKIECQYTIEKNNIENKYSRMKGPVPVFRKLQGEYFLGYDALLWSKQEEKELYESDVAILKKYSRKMPEDFYKVLNSNLQFDYGISLLRNFKMRYEELLAQKGNPKFNSESIEMIKKEIKKMSQYYYRELFTNHSVKTPSPDRFITKECITYWGDVAKLKSFPNINSYSSISNYILTKFDGKLKDLLIAKYVLEIQRTSASSSLPMLLKRISDTNYVNLLTQLIDVSKVGKKAYDFQLKDLNERSVKLSDFKGKIVLIDFWFTGCGACRSYYQEILSEAERHFINNRDVIFLPICVDAVDSVFRNSVKKEIYTSANKENVINLSTAPQGANHPLIKHYNVTGYPQPLIVDRDGNIYNYSRQDLRYKENLFKTIEKALNK